MQRQEAARSHRLVQGEEQGLASVAFQAGHTPRLHHGLAGHELQVGAATLLLVLPSSRQLDALLGSALVITLGAAMAVIYTRLTSADARWAISGTAIGLIASAALAALQVRGGEQAATFTYHPNIAAGFFLVGAFGMLGAAAGLRLSSGARARALQALCFVAFVASLAGLAFTGSRSGVIGFLAGAVVLVPFLIARAWQRLRGWSVPAFLGVAGGLAALAYFGLFPSPPLPGPTLWSTQASRLAPTHGSSVGARPERQPPSPSRLTGRHFRKQASRLRTGLGSCASPTTRRAGKSF